MVTARLAAVSVLGLILPLMRLGSLAGQPALTGGADVVFSTGYVWRGITRSSGCVLQPDAVVGARWAGSDLVVGGWANIELCAAEPGVDRTLGKRFGEWNAWLEYAAWSGPLELAIGYSRYGFDEGAAAAAGVPAFNTGELYADLWLRLGSFMPGARVWLDVEEVNGAYVEVELAYRFPVFPLAVPSLYVGALGGFSAGQAVNGDHPEDPAYFSRDGLTHIDVWSYTQVYLPIGPLKNLYGTAAFHFQVNVDEATKPTGAEPATDRASTKWWLSLMLNWYN